MNPLRTLSLWILLAVWLSGTPGAALEIELPVGARLTAERNSTLDSFSAPVGVFDGDTVPSVVIEGGIERRAWRITAPGLTPLQVILPLRTQLESQGYDLAFECAARACGGFDFRFDIEVLPGPNMYVNIAEYRYLTALRGARGAPDSAVGVLVSVTRGAAYVQVISALSTGASEVAMPALEAPPKTDTGVSQTVTGRAMGDRLLSAGHAALAELAFATGTTQLGEGPFASLAELAEFMQQNPDYQIALVGHTDAVGGLSGNIRLSRERAQSVLDRLVGEYGVSPDRLSAEGMGYLAPVASNLTEEGRELNRRVEAVLLPAQ